MKDDLTAITETSVENEVGATAASGKTQEKASKPSWRSAGAGRGVWHGLIDAILIAAGLSFLVFLNSVRDYIEFHGLQELSSELVLDELIGLIFLFAMVMQFVGPFVLLAGAILGSCGVFDEKKKRPPEPPPSAPEP